jgi:parallel beta-helix repeat protein
MESSMKAEARKFILLMAVLMTASFAGTACDDDNGDDPPTDVTDTGDTGDTGDTDDTVDGETISACTYEDVDTCLNAPVECDASRYEGKTKEDYEWPDEVAGNGVETCDHYAMPDCDGLSGLLEFVNRDVSDGSTICFTDELYVFTSSLNLPSNSNVTLAGMGDGYDVEGMFGVNKGSIPEENWDRETAQRLPEQGETTAEGHTQLDFSNLQAYARNDDGECEFSGGTTQGIVTQAGVENITFKDFAVIDTQGDAIETSEIKNVTFHGVTTQWTAESCVDNGAYGIYPVKSTGVIVEYSVVEGAADAGIYVGQSDQVRVHRSVAFRNVAGIEIENTTNSEVTEMYAYDNAGGMLIFNLPGIIKQGYATKLHNNNFSENNWVNFADPSTSVGNVPSGTGIMVLANDYNDVFDNYVVDNGFTGVLTVHYSSFLGTPDLDAYNVLSERNCIRDNTIGYTQPKGDIEVGASPNGTLIRDVLWTEGRGAPTEGGEVAPIPDLVEGGCESARPADFGDDNIWDRDDVCPYIIGGLYDFSHTFTSDEPCAPVTNAADVTEENDSETDFEINNYSNNVNLDDEEVTFASVKLCNALDSLDGGEDADIELTLGDRAASCNYDLPCQTGRYGVECEE